MIQWWKLASQQNMNLPCMDTFVLVFIFLQHHERISLEGNILLDNVLENTNAWSTCWYGVLRVKWENNKLSNLILLNLSSTKNRKQLIISLEFDGQEQHEMHFVECLNIWNYLYYIIVKNQLKYTKHYSTEEIRWENK